MTTGTERKETNDQEVRKAQRGDAKAFASIVRRYLPLVVSVAYSMVGDTHVAEDMAQETFHKAYRRLGTLRDPKRIGAWLYGIARTTSIDWLRKRRGRPLTVTDLSRLPGEVASEEEQPDAAALREEEKGIVRKILFELPENHREVLILKHMRDLPYAEVASFLGTTVAAVESLLFRARTAFKEKLKRHGIGPTRPSE